MKNAFANVLIRTGGSLALLLILAGCAAPSYEKGDAASQYLNQASAEVQAESRAIDATVAALKTLVSEPAADLKPQFRSFRQALSRLETSAIRTVKTGDNLARKGETYLAQWEKELSTINYDYIRERSQARREEVRSQFEAVNRRYSESQAAVDPLINYLRDIRIALASDLTQGGVNAIRNIATNAEDNARKVQTALSNLNANLQTLGERLSSQGPAPAAK